jgi:hypothetical protein
MRRKRHSSRSRRGWELAAGSAAGFNPAIASATAQIFNVASTSVSVALPATVAGDRLLLLLNRSSASTDAIATPSGWTALDTSTLTGTAASFCRAYYMDNAAGTTADFTGGTSTLSTSLVWKLTGCDLTVAPVANGTVQNSNTTTVDPGALTGPNAGASQRNLWFAYVGTSTQDTTLGGTPAVTAFPTGYINTGTSTTTDVSTTNGCGQGWGSKVATAGSDDPSAWTYCPAGTGRALAINIAVRGVIG